MSGEAPAETPAGAPAPAPPTARPGWGEGADDPDRERSDPSLRRALRRLVRRFVKQPLLHLGLAIVPLVYLAYLRFVWWTSRHVDRMDPIRRALRDHGGAVGVLWHEEVFTVAWGYRDFRPHTLASIGDAGEAIARLLTRCGFVVFRGGSARARTRRRPEVLRAMIDHMRTTPDVVYGITVDGSVGPRYVLKGGSAVIARECRKPIVPTRTWYRRLVRLPTWDRMAVPLPFNTIIRESRAPILPPGAEDDASLESFRLAAERALLELARDSYAEMRQRMPEALVKRLGEHGIPAAVTPAP